MKIGKIIIFSIIFFILSIIVFVGSRYLLTESRIRKCQEINIDLKRKTRTEFEEKNYPSFAKDFAFNGDFQYLPEIKDHAIFDLQEKENYFKNLSKITPDNLDDFKVKLVPEILKLMEDKKTDEYPSTEESFKNPYRPSNRSIDATIDYWCGISYLFEKKGDFITSLLIKHGALYLIRELELNYGNCNDLWFKFKVTCQSNKLASLAIIEWASKPHPECKELSKKVALDILEIVKLDCNLTRYVEYSKYLAEQVFDRFINENNSFGNKIYKSSYYKEMYELFINKPLYFESKTRSFYEIKNDYENYKNHLYSYVYDFNRPDHLLRPLPNYIYNPERTIILYIFTFTYPKENLFGERKYVEEYLGYMEFAAIALLINSYYCEKNKLPKSIEQLEDWLNIKLPHNRIDDSEYEINTKGEHLLTFKHLMKTKNSKQLYFDFSK